MIFTPQKKQKKRAAVTLIASSMDELKSQTQNQIQLQESDKSSVVTLFPPATVCLDAVASPSKSASTSSSSGTSQSLQGLKRKAEDGAVSDSAAPVVKVAKKKITPMVISSAEASTSARLPVSSATTTASATVASVVSPVKAVAVAPGTAAVSKVNLVPGTSSGAASSTAVKSAAPATQTKKITSFLFGAASAASAKVDVTPVDAITVADEPAAAANSGEGYW